MYVRTVDLIYLAIRSTVHPEYSLEEVRTDRLDMTIEIKGGRRQEGGGRKLARKCISKTETYAADEETDRRKIRAFCPF